MGWGDTYWLALVLVGASAAFNRVALVILLTWMAGHLAVLWGAPSEWVNLIQHAYALGIASRLCAGTPCFMATSLFVPLVLIDGLLLAQLMDAVEAWWWVLGLAVAQAIIVPLGNDWQRIAVVWSAYIATPHRGPQWRAMA